MLEVGHWIRRLVFASILPTATRAFPLRMTGKKISRCSHSRYVSFLLSTLIAQSVWQRGRWYPTAAILPNGTILVIGGETGSNAAPQPNLEILPKPAGGDTVVNLDWLARTDPNNLYPFVIILPSQRIFVGMWTTFDCSATTFR